MQRSTEELTIVDPESRGAAAPPVRYYPSVGGLHVVCGLSERWWVMDDHAAVMPHFATAGEALAARANRLGILSLGDVLVACAEVSYSSGRLLRAWVPDRDAWFVTMERRGWR